MFVSMAIFCQKSLALSTRLGTGKHFSMSFKQLNDFKTFKFRINDDWSFDDGIVEKYHCLVRSFDPRLELISYKLIFFKEIECDRLIIS